jgi:hypothetical protein
MNSNVEQFALLTGVFMLAGAVKGIVGMGLPTVAMGLLGLFLPVPIAASLITVPSFVTNFWQMTRGASTFVLARRLAPMLIGIVAGVLIGGRMMANSEAVARQLLGAILIVYALAGVVGLRLPQLAARRERTISAVVGAVTGVLTAATGVFVVPSVPYLSSLELQKSDLSQAMGMAFTTATVSLAVNLSASQSMDQETLIAGSILLLPALVGMWAGQKVRDSFPEGVFKRIFFVAMLALGVTLLV